MAQIGLSPNRPTMRYDDEDLAFPFTGSNAVVVQGPVELLPNPDFVFPARPLLSTSAPARPEGSELSNLAFRNQLAPSQAAARRQRQRPSFTALPAFTFNPSASPTPTSSLDTPALSSGPLTPTSPLTPSRASGHRRGGSEFIGGDGKGGSGLLSTSPTKGDGILPPPASTTLGPPPGRRGHAHRRSGAVSVHDIQSILQPKDAHTVHPRAESAPTTPMDVEPNTLFSTPPHSRSTTTVTALRNVGLNSPSTKSTGADSPPPQRPVSARRAVGFADRVEYIRPLSTISSETEGSMSTIRGHSVTNSLSSVLSVGANSPPSARVPRTPLAVAIEDAAAIQRPKSAGAVLDSKSKDKEGLNLFRNLGSRPRSSHGSPKDGSSSPAGDRSPKRRSFGWWEHKSAIKRPVVATGSSDCEVIDSPPDSPLSSPELSPEEREVYSNGHQPRSAATLEPARKPRKVKSWASSLMSRKSKPQQDKPKCRGRPPTPPHPSSAANFEANELAPGLGFEPDFDADNTVTILATPSPKRPREGVRQDLIFSSVSKPPFDDESASPVIDLDAALGPFNTPPLGPNARSYQRHPPRARHSMHNLPIQAHRRAESAPELVPFDTKMKQTVMEDVFEEDEDTCEGQKTDSGASDGVVTLNDAPRALKANGASGMGIHIVESDSNANSAFIPWPPNDLSPWSTSPRSPSATSAHTSPSSPGVPPSGCLSQPSLAPLPLPLREHSPVEVVEADEEPRASSLTRDSDSTITPSITPDGGKEPEPLMTLTLPMPQHTVMTPDTLSSSSFSGRDFTISSLASIDTPRLGTATSSVAETRSVSFGEPGPEVRMSYEDVPSLSSSRSTMTSPPQHPLARPSSSFIPDNPRSTSLSLPPGFDYNRAKRSSIVSLSRLVGISSGERSKLSIESRPQSQHSNSTTGHESKKSKRFSKLMNMFSRKHSSLGRS